MSKDSLRFGGSILPNSIRVSEKGGEGYRARPVVSVCKGKRDKSIACSRIMEG